MAETMHGVLTGQALALQRVQAAHCAEMREVRGEITKMTAVLEIFAGPKRARRNGTV